MMRLPLYAGGELLAVDATPPREPNRECTLCALHKLARKRCIQSDGEAGGLLLIGESPGSEEDSQGKPFVGPTGMYLRRWVSALWKDGPVAYDNAIRCFPGKDGLKGAAGDRAADACRPYLSHNVRKLRPKRIVTLGAWSALSLTGRSVPPLSTRRGYAYRDLGDGEPPVPVFFVLHPTAALRNRFVREWFEADLRWALSAELPALPPRDGSVFLVDNVHDARVAVQYLRSKEWVAWDTETAGVMWSSTFRVLCVSFAAKGDDFAYVWTEAALADPETRKVMLDYLCDAKAPKIGQNVKYDLSAIGAAFGRMPRGIVGDTRLWRKLLDPEAAADLATMAELVGMGGHKDEAQSEKDEAASRVRKVLNAEARRARVEQALTENLAPGTRRLNPKALVKERDAPLPTLRDAGVPAWLEPAVRDPNNEKERWLFGLLPKNVLYRYNARDSVSTAKLGQVLEARMRGDEDISYVWDTIVSGASSAVAQMEAWGVAADKETVRAFGSYIRSHESEAFARLDRQVPGMNWRSGDQIAELLYEKLKLPVLKKTPGGAPSTDADTLEALRGKHPFIADLLDYRRWQTMKKYADGDDGRSGMLQWIQDDDRIHPTILLDGARSGRSSCQDPNLQNIMRAGTPEGKMARDVFIATPGNVMLEYDYSQLELRIAAMLSGDPVMIEMFNSGIDFHLQTARMVSRMVWNVAPEDVTKEMRAQVKPIVFGVLYGKGDVALAADLNCTVELAKKMREAIFGRFKVLDAWCKAQLRAAQLSGYTRTYWNGRAARRRYLPNLADKDGGRRSVAEHGSFNTPVQGSASDYCIASLASIVDYLLGNGLATRLVLPVHDAILLDVPPEEEAEVSINVRRIMCGWYSGPVPLKVDGKRGRAWGSLEEIKEAA